MDGKWWNVIIRNFLDVSRRVRLTVGNAISLKRLESHCHINPRMAEIIWTNAQDCKRTFALNAKEKLKNLETGPPFLVVIQAKWRSSRFQEKSGSTFYQTFTQLSSTSVFKSRILRSSEVKKKRMTILMQYFIGTLQHRLKLNNSFPSSRYK